MEFRDFYRRIGVFLFLVGGVGLYIFYLYVWAGNPPNLPMLAALLGSVIVGVALIRKFRPQREARPESMFMKFMRQLRNKNDG